jgi:asparagine N-glycosylation enzyme membrane subunit Stt3
MEKWLCLVAMAVAGLLVVLYGLDLATGQPFGRIWVQDIALVLTGGLVVWQGYETWREVS